MLVISCQYNLQTFNHGFESCVGCYPGHGFCPNLIDLPQSVPCILVQKSILEKTLHNFVHELPFIKW